MQQETMFEDRRSVFDRRTTVNRFAVPVSGCRRDGSRRGFNKDFQRKYWWLQTSYVNDDTFSDLKLVGK